MAALVPGWRGELTPNPFSSSSSSRGMRQRGMLLFVDYRNQLWHCCDCTMWERQTSVMLQQCNIERTMFPIVVWRANPRQICFPKYLTQTLPTFEQQQKTGQGLGMRLGSPTGSGNETWVTFRVWEWDWGHLQGLGMRLGSPSGSGNETGVLISGFSIVFLHKWNKGLRPRFRKWS